VEVAVRIEYTLDVEDWVAFYVYSQATVGRRSPRRPWIVRLLGLLLANLIILPAGALFTYGLVWYVTWAASSNPDRSFLGFVPLVVAGVFVLIMLAAQVVVRFREPWRFKLRPKYRALSRVETWMLRRHVTGAVKTGRIKTAWRYQLSLDAVGFTEVAELHEATAGAGVRHRRETAATWRAVDALETTGRHAFFIVGRSGWLIVPSHAFATEQLFRQFVAQAREWLAASRVEIGITATLPTSPADETGFRPKAAGGPLP
jgi:hypothetical protein